MGGGPQITVQMDTSDFDRKLTEQRIRIREAKALVSSLNREIDQTARKGQQVTNDMVGKLQAAEARLNQEKKAFGNLQLDSAMRSLRGRGRSAADEDDDDDDGISVSSLRKLKKGFKKFKRGANAAIRIYDAFALKDAIEALDEKKQEQFDDAAGLGKVNKTAAAEADRARGLISAVQTAASLLGGPVGRVAGALAGAAGHLAVNYGERGREEAEKKLAAQELFKSARINEDDRQTSQERLREFLGEWKDETSLSMRLSNLPRTKAGAGKIEDVEEVYKYVKEHASEGLKEALKGNVQSRGRAQQEFDKVNKREHESHLHIGAYEFGSPVEIFLANDRAHAFNKRWTAMQNKRPAWRIGD